MNIIKRFFGKKYLTPKEALNIRFFGGQIVPYNNDKRTFMEKGYLGNDIVASIVDLITNTAKIAPWNAYKVIDEGAYKKYNEEIAKKSQNPRESNMSWKQLFELRKKALELYVNDERLNRLLKFPNEDQTFADLNQELWMYKLVTGDYYEYWEQVPSGGLNAGLPKTLSALPSHEMLIKSGVTLPLTADKYYLTLGQMVEFDKEQILHEKYANPKWDVYGRQLYGLSPWEASNQRIQRNNLSQKAGAVSAQNGGQRGVAYYDDARLDPNDDRTFEQMSLQKASFQNEMRMGDTDGASHVAWSQYKVGFQQLGFSAKDNDFSTIEAADLRMLCARVGVPSQLLNDSASKTFNTVVEAEKALITRCCLPLLYSRRDSFNRKMNRGDNVVVDFDLSVYDQLQPNKKELAEFANMMPINNARKLELVGEDVPEDWTEEERKVVLVPSSLVNVQDLMMPPDQGADEEVELLNSTGNNAYNNNNQ